MSKDLDPESCKFFYFMETKKCNKCEQVKSQSQFYKHPGSRDGLSNQCKDCKNAYNSKWKGDNPEYMKDYYKQYYKENMKAILAESKEWRNNNPDLVGQNSKQWREGNPDYNKKWRENNPHLVNGSNRKWREGNPNYISEYYKHRKETDPIFKLICNIRSNISISFKRACNGSYAKKSKTLDILGCNFEFFINYISSQFTEGMTLYNHGEWHLDHITPISSAQTEQDIIKLCHYSNFQPLWKEDNLKKSNKTLGKY